MNFKKILICADIHKDAGSADYRLSHIKEEKPDLLVHCGDLSSWGEWKRSLEWLIESLKCHIALVPGNHDFYCKRRQNIWEIQDHQESFCKELGVTYLQKENLQIGPHLWLVGSSLWYDYSFKLDRDYSDRELEEGFSNGIQWNDMISVDTGEGIYDPMVAKKLLGELQTRIKAIPESDKLVVVSHCCPYEELNAHKPSLFNAYSGQKNAGKYFDTLGDRVVAGYCGHTHRKAVYKQWVNTGSDYDGLVKYKIFQAAKA